MICRCQQRQLRRILNSFECATIEAVGFAFLLKSLHAAI